MDGSTHMATRNRPNQAVQEEVQVLSSASGRPAVAPHGQREHDDEHERDRARAELVDEVTEIGAFRHRAPTAGA